MKCAKSFSLENEPVYDGKSLTVGLESSLSKMYIGTIDGNLR